MKSNLITCYKILFILFILPFVSCHKTTHAPNTAVTTQVAVQFNATAADTSARLNVQIYDTNSGHVYYKGTTTTNTYSSRTNINEGTSITYVVNTGNTTTDISSQIIYNGQAVAVGYYNTAQSQGLPPAVTVYYKVP